MLAAKCKLAHAQKVKEYLLKNRLFNQERLLVKQNEHIYFPLLKKVKVPGAEVLETKIFFPKKYQAPSVESLLAGKLSTKELALIPKAQEVVGKILILEIPEELQKKEKLIAQAYLQANKNLETVVKKGEIHSGEYRLRTVEILAGKKSKETIHQENGIKLKLDLEKTYFSARSGSERLRIAQLVKKCEKVLVMFSGCGPFPLVIAKHSAAQKIVGVEINPLAHEYAIENLKLNGFGSRVVFLAGDVYDIMPKIKEKFERIVMPLPKTGDEFLPLALTKAQVGTIVHFYAFLKEADVPEEKKKILEICQKAKHPVKVLRHVNCGQFAPYVFRMCFDLKVLR